VAARRPPVGADCPLRGVFRANDVSRNVRVIRTPTIAIP
jgi:hypothetical protein